MQYVLLLGRVSLPYIQREQSELDCLVGELRGKAVCKNYRDHLISIIVVAQR